jgi:hypothetical protein
VHTRGNEITEKLNLRLPEVVGKDAIGVFDLVFFFYDTLTDPNSYL